ncbi:MAG TPA: tRNA (adenosine(37)-N6)-dimethylallyltransferase MiaA [Candidatus Babeliales bacterium]|nr:tRNA (adenosine(37)-N6)-dimethylallyltransferase MiaA [Candidatus Babeliales bacterium]
MLLIAGPTGVGKTELALKLAAQLPAAAIINADLGQCYTPLTIGTAKPDWRAAVTPHYLFDILDQPLNFTAFQYRKKVATLLAQAEFQQRQPLLVGGSGFYLQALLFRSPLDGLSDSQSDNAPPYVNQPHEQLSTSKAALAKLVPTSSSSHLWAQLAQLDPVRAQTIAPQDHYRLQRALAIYQQTGLLPSQCAPQFDPISAKITLVILTRDTPELYQRIDQRVLEMLADGWLQEVFQLHGTTWADFLCQKRLIGYDDLLRYFGAQLPLADRFTHAPDLIQLIPVLQRLAQTGNDTELRQLTPQLMPVIQTIQQRTRRYAKRQMTFYRMLARKLNPGASPTLTIHWWNLTDTTVDRYIKRLLNDPNLAN